MASEELLKRVEEKIEAIEALSAAEIVVSLKDASDDYRDLDLLWGAIFATAALSFQIWSPLNFAPDWVPPNVVLSGLVGYGLSRWLGSFRRLLLTSGRAEREVARAARALLTELGVTATRERTGLLLYVSRLERRLALVPDSGVGASLSENFWQQLDREVGRARDEGELLRHLEAALEKLKGPLQRGLPRRDDDIDELPNRPVELR